MPPIDPNVLIIGLVAIVITILIGYLIQRLGIFEDDADETTASTRIDRETDHRDRDRIPLRDKTRQLSGPMKIAIVCLGIAGAVVSLYTYFWFKSGSPQEFAYATQLQYVLVAVVGIATGVKIRSSIEDRIGRVYIDYESKDGTDIEDDEIVYFDPARTERGDDGEVIVTEQYGYRILGIFSRRKLAGHDRDLRGDRPLGGYVKHELPDHAERLDETTWKVRTQQQIAVGPESSRTADYRYKPPVELPYKAHVTQREQIRKMRTRISSMDAQRAEAEAHVRDLIRKLENREYSDRRDLLDEVEEIIEMMGPRREEIHVQRGNGHRRHDGHQEHVGDRGDGRPQRQGATQ